MLELMRKRRSIRKYSDKPIEKEKLDAILECALRSPSSRGRQPWKITVVTSEEDKKRISAARPGGPAFAAQAAVVYIVAGYPEVTDIWIEDCSIVATVIQLEAETLGLGSCWGHIRNRMHDDNITASEYLKSTLNLDKECEVLCIIAVGYKGEEKEGHKEVPYEKSEIR